MINLKLVLYSKPKTFNLQSGQALIELLLVFGLLAILLPALATSLIASREGKPQQIQRLAATTFLTEAQEAIRSIREKGWSNLADGTYHPTVSGSTWSLAAGVENVAGFTRQIVVSSAQRDATGAIVDSGGIADPSTKKIVTSVSWTIPASASLQSVNFLSRHLSNTTWLQTTQAQFNLGTTANTQVVTAGDGAVELAPITVTSEFGNRFLVTGTSAVGNMTASNHRTSLRFTAQAAKTVTAIRVYLHSEVGTSPNYRYGIQADTGGNPSGTYLGSGTLTATSAGWKTITLSPSVAITAGTAYHIVVQYNSGTISSSRHVALRRTTPQNLLYPKTNTADPQSNTLFYNGTSWTIQNFQPIYELDFSDSTFEGNPYEVNTEISVFGANWYAEKFTVTGSNKIAQSISFCIRKNGTPTADLQVELRNTANTSLYTGTLVTSAAAPTTYTCPTSWQTHTFSPSPITLTAGTTYRIILKSPASTSSNHYRFNRLNTTNAVNFNSITYDGTNSVYSVSTNSGSSWTDTNNLDMAGFFFTIQSAGQFATAGTFESQTFDCTLPTAPATIACNGAQAGYNYITANVNEPAGTNIRLQVATNNDDTGWTFLGPDGTASSYFDNSGGIYISLNSVRFFLDSKLF